MNQELANELKNNGFVIVKNVLSGEEISHLRTLVNDRFSTQGIAHNHGLTQPNAAIEVPEINWLFYHSKVLSTFRELLGEEIVFTSHCDVHSSTLSGWHKDDGLTVMDGGYFGFPAYDEPDCGVYKMAIYLQDHVNNQGGLTVRKGSHLIPGFDRGEEVSLQTRKGDAVIFDVRLTHTGQRNPVPIAKLQKPLNVVKGIGNRVFKIDRQKSDRFFQKVYNQISGKRLSIFFTFGVNNEYTHKFAVNNMKRQMKQTNNNESVFLSSSTKQALLDNNVELAEQNFEALVCETSY